MATGPGLALSHGLIQAMGGTLAVGSKLGKGSVFNLRLPLAEAPEEALLRLRSELEVSRPLAIVDQTLAGEIEAPPY